MEVKTSANFSIGSQREIEILFLEHQVGDAGQGILSCQIIKKLRNVWLERRGDWY